MGSSSCHESCKSKGDRAQRCRLGRLWPMPIRETDLGHIYAEVTVRPLAGSNKVWKGQALVDTGATDTFLPASILRKLGIVSAARRSYELADDTERELPIGFGVIEVEGLAAGATLVFADEDVEPLLGVTVLESTGLLVDPQREQLIRRAPKRKAGVSKKRSSERGGKTKTAAAFILPQILTDSSARRKLVFPVIRPRCSLPESKSQPHESQKCLERLYVFTRRGFSRTAAL